MNLTENKNSQKCIVHNVILKKKSVKRLYGKAPDKNISTKNCPFAKRPDYGGKIAPLWPKYSLSLIYACDSCTIVYRKLKESIKQ